MVVLAPQTAIAQIKHCRSFEAQAPYFTGSLPTGIRVSASKGLVSEAKHHARTFWPCMLGCLVPKLGYGEFSHSSKVISFTLLKWIFVPLAFGEEALQGLRQPARSGVLMLYNQMVLCICKVSFL